MIVAASGHGTRLGGDMPKQFQMLAARPILAHTLGVFDSLEIVEDIVVAVPSGYLTHTHEMVARYGFNKVTDIVAGGASRGESIYSAIMRLPKSSRVVLVHDGVRPFVSAQLIKTVAEAAYTHGAAVAGLALTDTIKEVDDSDTVQSTPDRTRFWRVQTPQGFTYKLLRRAYDTGKNDNILGLVTDDSMLVERLGMPVKMVCGSHSNIKITTTDDLIYGEMLTQKFAIAKGEHSF